MTRYFKSSRGNYNAISDKTVPYEGSLGRYYNVEQGDPVYPTSLIDTTYHPTQFIPYWDELTPTGLSQQFHDLLFDESMDSDSLKVASRAIGSQRSEVNDALGNIAEAQIVDENYKPADIETIQKKFHPPALFHYEPERLEIGGAFSHPTMRHTVPVMLQMAKQDYPNAKVVASDDLSAHSAKLARNARERGLVEPHPGNPRMRVTNEIDFSNDTVNYTPEPRSAHHEAVPEDRVQQAKNELRQTLRENRPKKSMSPQFDHPTLF